jgi:hypothetical protein
MSARLTSAIDVLARFVHGGRLRAARPAIPASVRSQLLSELRSEAAGLPPLGNGPEVEATWVEFAKQFREALSQADPDQLTRWDIVHRTMFLTNRRTAFSAWKALKADPHFQARWASAIVEDATGAPTPFLLHGKTSPYLIWQAIIIRAFERFVGQRIDDQQFVLEYGGGYGSMCRLTHRLGFRGRYLIFDLPELGILQRYFLRGVGVPVVSAEQWFAEQRGTLLVTDLDVLQRLLSRVLPGDRSVFWATWSISESPARPRDLILPRVAEFDSYLIGFQPHAAGFDNTAYFGRWQDGLAESWRQTIEPIDHAPPNRLAIGTKRRAQ